MSTLRTFRAPDARAALAMVKAALGAEAVIISTRDVSNGLFRAKEIEVTAALAEPVPLARPPTAHAYVAPPPEAKPAPSAPPALRLVNTPPAPAGLPVSDELKELKSAVDEVRREMGRVVGQVRLERELKLPPPAIAWLTRLTERGMDDAMANELVHQAMNMVGPLDRTIREALSERVVSGRAPWLPDGRRRVIALVGPTGVGKTTTLAKIAARAIMESRLKVALVTVDTYRIGASEQVARYGEIMGVPTFVARDRIELGQVLDRCKGVDLVLVDTAGRSASEAVARQAEMLRSVEGISLYLVLSACAGPREAAAVAERYRALAPDRLVVTKLDEAVGPGSIVSASVRLGRPIVAIADGQRVPEDIHSPPTEELVERIIGPATAATATPETKTLAGGR